MPGKTRGKSEGWTYIEHGNHWVCCQHVQKPDRILGDSTSIAITGAGLSGWSLRARSAIAVHTPFGGLSSAVGPRAGIHKHVPHILGREFVKLRGRIKSETNKNENRNSTNKQTNKQTNKINSRQTDRRPQAGKTRQHDTIPQGR